MVLSTWTRIERMRSFPLLYIFSYGCSGYAPASIIHVSNEFIKGLEEVETNMIASFCSNDANKERVAELTNKALQLYEAGKDNFEVLEDDMALFLTIKILDCIINMPAAPRRHSAVSNHNSESKKRRK